MSQPPIIKPPVAVAQSDNELRAAHLNKSTALRDRLRAVCLKLAGQSKDRSIYDNLLSCCTLLMAYDGRLPVTPQTIITTASRHMIVTNHLARAIINWGTFGRDEDFKTAKYDEADLLLVEKVAEKGIQYVGAYPKEPGSIIHVVRTVTEERALREKWAAAKELALSRKHDMREAEKVLNGQDTPESDVAGRLGGVGETPPPAGPMADGEQKPEVPAP